MKILLAFTATVALFLTPSAIAGGCSGGCPSKKGDKKADPKETMTLTVQL